MRRRVVVTGLGAVSGLGLNVAQFWKALRAGRCGFATLRILPSDKVRVRVGAEVPDYYPERHFGPDDLPLLDRFSQLALIAAREAIADAGLTAKSSDLASGAVVLGTGCGGKETDEQTYARLYAKGASRVSPLTIPRGMPSAAASQLSMHLGICGPTFSVTSACSSANHAIGQALWFVRSGLVELALTGGTDAPFTVGLMKSWEALRVLSKDTCRPFSHDRSGIVLGEGSGMLVLESLESARRRGAQIYAEICGCGMSSDAGHITQPSAQGAFKA
ncbi:MAG: beta-ketoacyl-[acyl-carrier-protein] synthase family protein, partial [Pseudomonadota bacterium]|nr:beta-ketoacyl-[acyl-carrier-protein] synthase family protein [Pseudomonadota bacterium]